MSWFSKAWDWYSDNIGIGGLNLIGKGAGLVLDTIANKENIQAQKEINQQNIQYAREASEKERQWALEDAAYMHPKQMMQRYREANLNPHLIYGNGASSTASMIRGTDVKTPNLMAPISRPADVGSFGDSVLDFYRYRMMDADIENKRAQNKLLGEKSDLNNLQISALGIKNARSQFEYEMAQNLKDTTMESAIAKVEQTKADTAKTLTETQLLVPKYVLQKHELDMKQANSEVERARIVADTALKTFELQNIKPEQLAKLKAEINKLYYDGQISEEIAKQRKAGLNPNDPAYMRVVVSLVYKLAKEWKIDLGVDPSYPLDYIRSGKFQQGKGEFIPGMPNRYDPNYFKDRKFFK